MKKIFLVLFLAVLLVGSVSASILDFKSEFKDESSYTLNNKVLNYNELWKDYSPIEIKSIFGVTRFKGAIVEHTKVCGQDCFSTMEIYIPEDGSLVDSIEFKTLQEDGKWVEQSIRKYNFKYLGDEGWIDYNEGDIVPAGEYILKLTGEKKPSRTVDWIIDTTGKTLKSWAIWGNISEGDDAEVILNSPVDNEVDFNVSVNVTSGALISNVSLWTNSTGSWHRNSTNVTLGSGLEVTGTVSLGGNLTYDYFIIHDGGKVNINATGYLNISAKYIYIYGIIDGTGDGFTAGSGYGSGNTGNSADDGDEYMTSGGSGAGHTGTGGASGTAEGPDETASGVSGGSAYGSDDNSVIERGSGGGNGADTGGGSAGSGGTGGGSVILNAHNILVNGTIEVNGTGGTSGNAGDSSSGGGGGSGGQIIIQADILNISKAKLSVIGGSGGNGDVGSGGGDFCATGGGGGSGGRIILGYNSLTNFSSGSFVSYFGGNAGTKAEDGSPDTCATSSAGSSGKIIYNSSYTYPEEVGFANFSFPFNLYNSKEIVWNVEACDSDGDCGFAVSNYTLFLDTTPPTIDIDSPNETFNYLYENYPLILVGMNIME